MRFFPHERSDSDMNYFLNLDPYSAHMKPVKLIGNNKTVLEVGCSSGYISELLKANGCHVYGIEIDPQAAQIAHPHCEQIIVGDIETLSDLPFAPATFDVILLLDVLEHLHDPLEQLRRLKTLLKSDGIFIVNLPNVANIALRWSLFCGRWNYTDRGLMDKTHLHFYTKKTAQDLLNHAGLSIVYNDINQGVDQIGLLRWTLLRVLRKTPWYHKSMYWLTRLWPEGFALQFMFVAKALR